MQGQFIVVEGLEGAGKSTVIETIGEVLQKAGKSVVRTREPGGTPLAEALRDCVKQDWAETVTTTTELCLMYAARSQLLENVITPALNQGQWVLADRHDWSSVAYQGGGRQIPMDEIDSLRAITLKGVKPDFTILLDIDPALGLTRASQRGQLDRIEQSGLAFFARTRQKYLELADQQCDRSVVIDASQTVDAVQRDVLLALHRYLGEDMD